MKILRVAAGVLNQTPLDWEGNVTRIQRAIAEARQAGVGLLCLPELCIPGYGCEDAFSSLHVAETSLTLLAELAKHSKGMAICVGTPVRYERSLYNGAALLVDGTLVGIVCKKNLAGSGVYYEPRWFSPWPAATKAVLETEHGDVPIGDLVFDVGGVRLGFEICEDAWVAGRGATGLTEAGVDFVLNPSASHFAFGKFEVRQRICSEGSRIFGATYIYSNLMGNESGRLIFDGGAIIASQGETVALGPRFSFAPVNVTCAEIDLEETRSQGRPTTPGTQSGIVSVDFDWQFADSYHCRPEVAAFEKSPQLKKEEFARAIALGLFDYMRKSYSRGFVISLSGGADSSATAVLAWLGLELAHQELDREAFREALSYLPKEWVDDINELRKGLICTAYQATKNSSTKTTSAAKALADSLGATHYYFDVQSLVDGYTERTEEALQRELTWSEDDLALQNIQARARGPMVWMLANIRRGLLLATSNRSEAAVGYATMDGDTCGGVSPIAGIDKAFLLEWLNWMEEEGLQTSKGMLKAAGLMLSNQLTPTAELRPEAQSQTDEKDLMPYPILEAIEEEAVRDRHPPVDVWKRVVLRFPEVSQKQMARWVVRFFTLFSRNQWKRERYAPSFHVDDESLDPKSWFRFPILSGGFKRELEELRNEADLT